MKKNILFVEPSTRIRFEKCTSPFKNAEGIDCDVYFTANYEGFIACILDVDAFTTDQQEIFENLIRDLMDGSRIYVMPGYDGIYRDLAVTLLEYGYAKDEQIIVFDKSMAKKKIMKYFEDNNIKFDEVYK